MTTQTLAKPRPGGAGAAERLPEAEPPAQLYPARMRLSANLAELERASADLEDYKARAERARLDENRAMEDEALSETEAAEKIQTAMLQKGVLTARIANREAAQAKLLKELKTAVNEAHNEHSTMCLDLLFKTREILGPRIVQAGRLVGNLQRELEEILENSELIQEIRSCEISSQSIVYLEGEEQIVGMAKRILAGYETIAALGRKQV